MSSISAQGGKLSFAIQPDKIGRTGTFDADALDWFQLRAARIELGTVQNQAVFPLEVGGTLTPTGAFKQAVYFIGEVDIFPRLEETFGWLAKATMGLASSVEDVNPDGGAAVGLNTHIFRFDPDSPAFQPWMAVRRFVPGAIEAERFGETGFDCKINNLSLTIPNMGKIAARISMQGRDVVYDDSSTWVYENTLENSTNTPEVGAGYFKIGGIEYPILGASIDIANNLTSPEQEMVVGDFRPDDFIALTRSATVRIVYKYENADLYRLLLTGEEAGTEWTNQPFIIDKDVNGYAFDAKFEAPELVGVTNFPYELRVRASRIVWSVDGPIRLQPGGYVTQNFVGTILEPADGEDYLQVVVANGQAAY